MRRPRFITTTIERGRPAVWDRDRRRTIHSYDPGQDDLARAMADKLNADGREVVQIGLDGASKPMLRYRDELHLPDHRRSIVSDDDRRRD